MSQKPHVSSGDVVVVGSFNTDLSLFTKVVPKPGQTVMGSKFLMGYGGKGANQAASARFLGASVRLIAKVGNDTFGRNFIEYLKSVGISDEGINVTAEASTGVAFITVEQGPGENRIIVVPGANMLLTKADVDHANTAGLLQTRVVLCQFEIPTATTLCALKAGKQNGALTILNPAPISIASTESKADISYRKMLDDILAVSDYCCPNETEAAALVCCYDPTSCADNQDTEDHLPDVVFTCLHLLAQKGVKNPIVTLGSKGAVLRVDTSLVPTQPPEDLTICQNLEEAVVIKLAAPVVTNVVDSTGAGDCFVGALAYFVAQHPNLGPIEHVRRAIWVASQSVRKAGTQASYPRRDKLPPCLFEPGIMTWPT